MDLRNDDEFSRGRHFSSDVATLHSAVTRAALGAHPLSLEVERGQFCGFDTAPQGDGIIDADMVGQIPVTQAVVERGGGGHLRWVVAAYLRVLNVQGLINSIPQPS